MERRRLKEIENVHRALRQANQLACSFLSEQRHLIAKRASERIRYEESKRKHRPKEPKPPKLIPYAGKYEPREKD
jgi:hypothetical protein